MKEFYIVANTNHGTMVISHSIQANSSDEAISEMLERYELGSEPPMALVYESEGDYMDCRPWLEIWINPNRVESLDIKR